MATTWFKPPLPRTHRCGWVGCERQIALDSWGCRQHWLALPLALRIAIVNAFDHGRGRLSSEWLAANSAALVWIRTRNAPTQKDAS